MFRLFLYHEKDKIIYFYVIKIFIIRRNIQYKWYNLEMNLD